MSSAEVERKRREALAQLKARQSGTAPSSSSTSASGPLSPSTSTSGVGRLSFKPSVPQSPEVLVPSSSPHKAKSGTGTGGGGGLSMNFINGATGNAAGGGARMGSVPSSNLGRPTGIGSTGQLQGQNPFPAGSPAHIMSSVLGKNPPSNTSASNTIIRPGGQTPAESPDIYAAKSRLKSKYPVADPDSPTSASASASGSPVRPTTSGSTAALGRLDTFVKRTHANFPNLTESRVREIVRHHGPDNSGAIIEHARRESREAARKLGQSSSAGYGYGAGVGVPSATKTKANGHGHAGYSTAHHAAQLHSSPLSTPTRLGGSSSSARPTPGGSSFGDLGPPTTATTVSTTRAKPAPKPKKNEKSSIYANRKGKKSRKRDPDEDSPEEDTAEDEDDDSDDDNGGRGRGGGGSGSDSEGGWSGGGRKKKKRRYADPDEESAEEEGAEGVALKAFNEDTAEMITGTISCTADQANIIIKHRPYTSVDQLRTKLNKTKGVSVKLFEQHVEITEGFVQIDSCLNTCDRIAKDISATLSVWRSASVSAQDGDKDASVVGTPRPDGMGLNDVKVDVKKVSEMLKLEKDTQKKKVLQGYIQEQPKGLSEGTVLKDYQLLGVNWLNLLYRKRIGCILADEMGLGKTIQVIAFITHLHAQGTKGPHMIFVPASTLENWIREFGRFSPNIDVQAYYGTQAERAGLRADLRDMYKRNKLEVVLASYTQVGSNDDLSFFRKKIEFETCIYDEGHKLKSCTTKAYADLMSIKPKWRLLLTGTPLQNNLQELVSLLMFIKKDIFEDAESYLRAIFKSPGHANLLSQQRVSRARTMLTPFVLRRRKAHVLDLPPKTERIHECPMTKSQLKLYKDTLKRSRKVLEEMTDDALVGAADEEEAAQSNKGGPAAKAKAKTKAAAAAKPKPKTGLMSSGSGANVLMDLRKAASHPLLFRKKYSDTVLKRLAKELLNTPRWCEAGYEYVYEDLEVMSDAEIHRFCLNTEYPEIHKFALEPEAFLEGGKVMALKGIVEQSKKEDKRILLFSQFVMILDILQEALDYLNIRYVRLDGSTKTDERQALVDEFNEDEEITVFLLSTKAGGVGINLTAASVVVIYDQDFNPHNDRQAADRAYRIGQEREVEVIKLITKDSIDEDMLNIGVTKLRLDDAVGGGEQGVAGTTDGGAPTLNGEAGAQKDDQTAKEMKKSLLTTLRNKFVAGNGAGPGEVKAEGEADGDEEEEEKESGIKVEASQDRGVKRARGTQAVKEEA